MTAAHFITQLPVSVGEQCVSAKNISTPVEVLEFLANSPHETVRCCVAVNPKTPVEALLRLIGDVKPEVRASVASNSNAPRGSLLRLIEDNSEWVRVAVAENPSAAAGVLKILSKDPSAIVRAAVALNHKTNRGVLHLLTKDASLSVRNNVAFNIKTPIDSMLTKKFLNLAGYTPLKFIFLRNDFTKQNFKKILYGDYPEQVTRAALNSVHVGDIERSYIIFKCANPKSVN
jgi:predicted RNA-binding protein YlxR (DUF448 family)